MSRHSRIDNIRDRIMVLVNSKNRRSGTPENFTVALKQPIKNVRSIEFASAEVPASYYVFNEGNNQLVFDSGSFTLSEGGYKNPTDVAIEIQIQWRAASLGYGNETCTYDADTDTFTLTADTAFIFYATSSAASAIGFANTTASVTSATSDFKVPGPIFKFNGPNTDFIINDGTADRTISLTPGNYTSSELASHLQTKINAHVSLSGFSVSYSTNTYKLTISAGIAFTVKSSGSASSLLGFTTDVASVANSVTSNVIADISGPNYLLVKSVTLSDPRETKTHVDNVYTDYIHKIVIDESVGDYIVDKANYRSSIVYPTAQTFQRMDFRLETEDGKLINLNGLDWSFGIVFVTR